MRHVFIGGGVLCLVTAGLWLSPVRTASQDRRTEVVQPDGWVAFDADVHVLTPSAKQLGGRFFRSSDGSTRLETYPAGDPSQKVVSIKNIARVRAYIYSPKLGWNSHPMVLPANGWRPLRYHKDMKSLSLRHDRIEGFELYQLIGVEGDVQFLAPALNFFPLVKQHVKDPSRWSYSNVRLREPDPMLFEPPPEASVIERTTPAGIVVEQVNPGEPVKNRPSTGKSGSCCPSEVPPK